MVAPRPAASLLYVLRADWVQEIGPSARTDTAHWSQGPGPLNCHIEPSRRGHTVGEHDNDQGPVEGQKTTATTLPCAQCGAELEFRPGARELKCGYCGHSQTIDVKEGAAVIEYDLNDAIARYLGRTQRVDPAGKREIKCQDCGADIVVAAGSQTARCDYCGGKRIIEEELPPDVLQPESIMPFAFAAADAVERFRKWLAGSGFFGRLFVKLFRPGALQQRANVQDLHGIYVPFWTYDSHAHSRWTAQAGYYYYVTESYTDSQGRRSTRQVRKIRWVWTNGQRRDFFDDWLVCASRQFYQGDLQKLMKKIEPFPTKALTPYDAKYLAGFRAERYSIDLKAGWELARNGMQAELYARCGRDVPGDTHRYLEVRSTYFGQSFKHALLPVYVMAYQFQNKQYNVLINGSTGEVQGAAPISWIKVLIFSLVVAALIGGAVALFMIFGQPQATPGPDPQPQQQNQQSAAPSSWDYDFEVVRDGERQEWEVQVKFAGRDDADRAANYRDFIEGGGMARHEPELADIVANQARYDPAAASRLIRQYLATQKWNGAPRFADVTVGRQ